MLSWTWTYTSCEMRQAADMKVNSCKETHWTLLSPPSLSFSLSNSVSIVPHGTFWGFPLETGLWGCSPAVDGAYEARIALFSQQLFHTVHADPWGGCDLSRDGKEDAASVRVPSCRPSLFVRLPLDNHAPFPCPEQVVTWIFEPQSSCHPQLGWRVRAASHRGCISIFVHDAMLLAWTERNKHFRLVHCTTIYRTWHANALMNGPDLITLNETWLYWLRDAGNCMTQLEFCVRPLLFSCLSGPPTPQKKVKRA